MGMNSIGRLKAGVTIEQARVVAVGLTVRLAHAPPIVSAVKVGGQTLHRLARRGIEVERPSRMVEVHRFEVGSWAAPGVLRAEVACSSGTYVRVLAADLGAALGGGAHVHNLRRTAVGSFDAAGAHPIEAVDGSTVLSPAEALRDLHAVTVDGEMGRLVGRGLPLDRVSLDATGTGPWALLDTDGHLLAVYEATETDRVRPAVVLAAR
jgi:tRNA pseudouridine55 synthase